MDSEFLPKERRNEEAMEPAEMRLPLSLYMGRPWWTFCERRRWRKKSSAPHMQMEITSRTRSATRRLMIVWLSWASSWSRANRVLMWEGMMGGVEFG